MALCGILFSCLEASINSEQADRLRAAGYAVSKGEKKIADFSTALVKPSWKTLTRSATLADGYGRSALTGPPRGGREGRGIRPMANHSRNLLDLGRCTWILSSY